MWVLKMIKKKNEDGTDGVFDVNDAKIVMMPSSPVSPFTKIETGHNN